MVEDARPTIRRRWLTIGTALVAAVSLAACSTGDGGGGDGSLDAVDVIAPADPGGGWDQTARAVSQVLTDSGLVSSAPVTNIGGAGGTVGLANLATAQNAATLMVTGSVMVGAVETNASEVRIEDTTPIAMLTEEQLVVVVPADSDYETIQDLVDDIVDRGPEVSVTGGSAGGTDHILAGLVLSAAGVEAADMPSTLNYVANSGGGEAVTMLLGGTANAGISGIGEFAEQIAAGELRALAVSGAERDPQLPDVPTLVESDIDVELTNWRGVLAPGDITDEERQALIDLVTDLHDEEGWTEQLETYGWADAFLTGDDFDAYLEEDIATAQETLQTIGLIE